MSPGLKPAALRPGLHAVARWATSPRVDWPTARRRFELAMRFPGAPRGTEVRPTAVGGVPAEELMPSHRIDDALLIYLHGGGYVTGSPRAYRSLVGRLATALGARAISVEYRLAPEHPHPAALSDARAVWRELTGQQGIDPGRIVIAGDSAGGGLALALALSLRDAGEPLPAALGLISPWVDLTADVAGRRPPVARDIVLTRGLLSAFARAFLAGAPAEDPMVSPLLADLHGLPPLVVHAGEDELFRADDVALVQRARAAGVSVTHEELPGLWHDSQMSAALMSEPAGGSPLRMAGALRAHLAGG